MGFFSRAFELSCSCNCRASQLWGVALPNTAMAASPLWVFAASVIVALLQASRFAVAIPPVAVLQALSNLNAQGPFLGIVVPNSYELQPLLDPSIYRSNPMHSSLDILGRRFYIGEIESHNVVIVMTGLSMLNAGITTELLLSFFNISGVLHYGIAGNANDELNIGDITIPKYWAHTGLWNWQRYGDGPNTNLSLEVNGDFTRAIGYLHVGDFNNPAGKHDNYLNNVWFQPEEVFPVTGTPEVREHHFWVPVDKTFYKIAKQLESLDLVACINTTNCLNTTPKVVRVKRGASANVFVDNAAYRNFLRKKFHISPIDMESASVSLVCLTNNVPFIAIRALSDLAGGSSEANQAAIFANLAATNAVIALTNFIKLI